jgi:hypothetical protein
MPHTHPRLWNGETLEQLLAKGYRALSNEYAIISRIDREDWREAMGATWSKDPLVQRKHGEQLGSDHYRRKYSQDKIERVPEEIFRQIPGDWSGENEFRP